jgi:choline dehydrogenase-like flavoprotein
MEYRPEELRSFLERFTGEFDSAHHLGTTRMSRDPRDGVVDGNLKVHSLPNLYVVGGSTFPTGSHANPTMTIVAIASRLVDHVANQILVSGTVR